MLINIKYNKITVEKIVKWAFLLTLILIVFLCHCKVPDYYTNREIAEAALASYSELSQSDFDNTYRNPCYFFYNSLFHICAISFEIMLICFLYKANTIKKIIAIKWLNNILRYLYLNISYPIWAMLNLIIVESELKSYIYVSIADSIMIPLLGVYALQYFFAFLYYPIVNILNYIVFNTKITNKFLIILYETLFVILLLTILIDMSAQFNLIFFVIHLIKIIYLLIIIQSICRLKGKIIIS